MEDAAPLSDDPAADTLAPEWARVAALIALAEAVRAGHALPEGFETAFSETQDTVNAGRGAGCWRMLREVLPDTLLDAVTALDLDLLALVLAAQASPVLGPRLQALQPQLNSQNPSLPLVQEVLMLDQPVDVANLMARIGSGAPLIAGKLIRIEREAGYLALAPTATAVRCVLRRPADPGPPPGADLIACDHGWDDLVLPDKVLSRLQEFASWISGREKVFGAWGGRPIGGPMALLSGGSGVGKSFAVSVLTHELRRMTGHPWVLYRLDLGRIVSKYVGETEKNLNALLDAVHGTHAILQIDEADGLLGKRGDVSDARDRYANLEVSHMLSRFEQHDGPVVLTTNLRANIDAAFMRRFQVVVDVPAPDATMRSALWKRLLPPAAPLADDVDVAALGQGAQLPGGGIHNAAIYAAILAHKDDAPISPAHLATACWRELGKEGRSLRRSELGPLAAYLPEGETA